MLHYLSNLSEYFGPLRLFDYLTFRAGGAGITAFLLVILLGGFTAKFLRRLNAQAADRYAGLFPPEEINKEKLRTPCMGGVLIVGAILVSSILWNMPNTAISNVLLFAAFGFAAIGFIDDYLKVVHKNRDGISGKLKLALQFFVASACVAALHYSPVTSPYMGNLMVPFFKDPVWVNNWFCGIFSVLVIVGTSNAVNLTDGKDGLSSGCAIFCTLAYAVFAYLMCHKVFARYLSIPFIPTIGEAVVFSSALVGACIGFLWHNCHPASMFMGDTGSLALGGIIGLLAVMVRQEILLVLVGGVFVMEIVSVIIQVASFKLTGKRVFLCTPIHHHFERKGWTETQIVVRFWILGGIFALIAISTLKLR